MLNLSLGLVAKMKQHQKIENNNNNNNKSLVQIHKYNEIFLEIIYPHSLVCWEPYLHVGFRSFIFEGNKEQIFQLHHLISATSNS